MIAIVTDSTAYLTRAEADRMRVTVVPMSYSVEGYPPRNEGCVDENGAYERLVVQNMGRIRTSQASYNAFLTTFEALSAAGHDVLCLTMSSRMSGTHGNAQMAAQNLPRSAIAVIDSMHTAAGLYLMVCEARRMADRGLSLQAIADAITALRGRIRTFFSVDDIAPLRQSGRLGVVKMSVSTILNIKPILKLSGGVVVSCGMARGRHEQLRALIDSAGAHKGALIVQYFTPDVHADQLTRALAARGRSAELRRVGPVLAAHLGQSVGITWIDEGNDES